MSSGNLFYFYDSGDDLPKDLPTQAIVSEENLLSCRFGQRPCDEWVEGAGADHSGRCAIRRLMFNTKELLYMLAASPQIVQVPAQLTAVIRLTVPRSEIQNVMGPGIQELMATIAAQDIAPAGPWLTHHLRRPSDVFDFEIAVPVGKPVAPAGRVQPGSLPVATVARAVYNGPYEGLGAAWGEFIQWIEKNGHTPMTDLWECYAVGPESGPDSSKWQTELNQPLVK